MLPYTFAMIGVTGQNLTTFLGKDATDILFDETASPHDIVSLQVRKLIDHQLTQLEKLEKLKEDDEFFEEQTKLTKDALKKHLPSLREKKTVAASTTNGTQKTHLKK